ncbi:MULTISPECIES: recombinase family protein [Streptomyces]|uniref:recombinase family protein n=1 Tax=Streptomyces TaxID=1883 RepID=UPI002248BE63|nr:recombinase family protein [Streptomyces sp. JHD 1]MCX2969302.1 recombinase family protein [Streptomyces sp. JHD 1]
MKPLIYGYMRVPSDMTDRDIQRRHGEMEAYAEAEGLLLATVFHEFAPETQSAFTELVEAVRRSAAHWVVVPTMRDLGLSVPLQHVLSVHLEAVGGAQVIGLDEL